MFVICYPFSSDKCKCTISLTDQLRSILCSYCYLNG
nr:MAG TPA: hypothetical protein [Caudoviricetes sp.]